MYNETKTNSNSGAIAKFYIEPVELVYESQQKGRPVFADREFVRITTVGDPKTELVREVLDRDREQYADAYNAFKRFGAGADEQIVGTPLSQLTWLSPSRIAELRVQNIHTVEHLAEVSDANLQNLGLGAREFKLKAQAFLDSAAGGAEAGKYAVENEHLKTEIERLTKQNAELAALADNNKKRTSAT